MGVSGGGIRMGAARRRRVLTALVVLVVLVAPVVASACATTDRADRADRADRLQPVDGPVDGPASGARATTAPAAPAAPTAPTPTTAAGDGSTSGRRAVDEVLVRYDRALTELAAAPDAVADPMHPLRAAWNAVVTPGTSLADDVTAAITARRRDGVIVGPGPGGLSYRHRALSTSRGADGSVGFTWCGWSPGVGRNAVTGTVVDDAVAHAHGTGQARPTPGGWMLDALDQTDLTVLPAGSPDPCPAEVPDGAGP